MGRLYSRILLVLLFGPCNSPFLATAQQPPQLLTAPAPGAPQRGVTVQLWTNLPGSSLDALLDHPAFPDQPSTQFIAEEFASRGHGVHYGSLVRGYLHPPQTGDYTFWISSDDNAELWLSTDERPQTRIKIAYINGWTESEQWDRYPSQKSSPVRLIAGKKYYVEAIHKQGDGGDQLAVGWSLPNKQLQRPIPGDFLTPFYPADAGPRPPHDQLPGSHRRTFTGEVTVKREVKLPYLLYLPPAYDPQGPGLPMVVFLHGSGENGTDLTALYQWGPHKAIRDKHDLARNTSFIILSPQCPPNRRWEEPEMTAAVHAIIDSVRTSHRIDDRRIALTGLSMGGQGVWAIALHNPDRFCALAPISGHGYRTSTLRTKIKIPCWIIAGQHDNDFVRHARDLHNTLRGVHPATRLTIVPNASHECWQPFYEDPEFYQWLFSAKTQRSSRAN